MTTNSCCTPTRTTGAPTTIENPTTQGATRPFVPAVDMTEGADGYILTADIPGARAEDVDIELERNELTIRARVTPRSADRRQFVTNEYGVGDYVRTFRIGDGIDRDNIEAYVTDGVLTLRLPKAEELKPRRVAVQPARA